MLQKFQVSYPNHTRAASLHMSRNFRLARRYFICFKKKGKERKGLLKRELA